MEVDIDKMVIEALRKLEEAQGQMNLIDRQMQEFSDRRRALLQQALRYDGELSAMKRLRGDPEEPPVQPKKEESPLPSNRKKVRKSKEKK